MGCIPFAMLKSLEQKWSHVLNAIGFYHEPFIPFVAIDDDTLIDQDNRADVYVKQVPLEVSDRLK